MTTRQRLERIIIGTLLDNNSHYDDVRGYITEKDFSDDTCRRLFGLIVQMRDDGAEVTDPNSIFKRYGESVTDMMPVMCQICTEYSFEYMKMRYNERQFMDSQLLCCSYSVANVEFIDYVKRFINIVMKDEKRKYAESTGVAA